MWVLELNDTEISLAEDLNVVYQQPGVAVILEDHVSFGDAALEQSRLHPRQAQTQHWQRLNADPVSIKHRSIKNYADLVYQHLCEIKRISKLPNDERVFVAVPSNSSPDQLSLLLGIAEEASIQIATLADLAVVTASTLPISGRCTFLDNGFHRTVLTRLEINGSVSRTSSSEVPECGFQSLIEGWIDAVADLFVQETRFDPLRIADTEQQLFNQLIENLASSIDKFTVEVSYADTSRRVTVARSLLATKSRQRLDALVHQIGNPTTLALSHRIARVPGLIQALHAAGHEVSVVEPNAIFSAAIAYEPNAVQPEDGINFVTELLSAGSQAELADPPQLVPTHLLHGTDATSLNDIIALQGRSSNKAHGFQIEPVATGFRLVPTAGSQVKINGVTVVTSASVIIGDIIWSEGEEFRLIRVVEHG